MRIIILLLATLIFTACGHHKIRFSKVKQKQKVVELSEIPSLKVETETAFTPAENNTETSEEFTNSVVVVEVEDDINHNSIFTPEEVQSDFPETVNDSTKISAQEINEIAEEALWAERNGTRSMVFSILSFVFALMAIGVLLLAFSTYADVLFILAIVLGVSIVTSLVLSMVFGVSSLRARYNTPLGRKRAIIGIVISSVFLFLMLINFVGGLF